MENRELLARLAQTVYSRADSPEENVRRMRVMYEGVKQIEKDETSKSPAASAESHKTDKPAKKS